MSQPTRWAQSLYATHCNYLKPKPIPAVQAFDFLYEL